MMNDSNQTSKPETFDAITKAAEQMLTDIFGSPIYFTDLQRLSEPDRRNLILRCTSVPIDNIPSKFIIKKVEGEAYNPEDPSSWDSRRFFNDWVGSQFLSSLGGNANHGPHFYGGSREFGFIVLEDMGEHRSLVEPLLHEDAGSAEAALIRYSTRLGKMHATTVNRYDEYERLVQSLGLNQKLLDLTEQDLTEDIGKVKSLLDSLEVQTESTLFQEIQEIVDAVLTPVPFLAYIHGDPCPDNVFDRREHLRLIDFEFGRFSHALIDAMYARMIFPTCWCANRIPESIVGQMEDRYRTELIQECPQAQEDAVWEQALVKICGYWLVKTLSWQLEPTLAEDRTWGIASLRQRILARLEAFVTTSEKFGYCPAVCAAAGRMLDTLRKRWIETDALPLYPAFQST